MRKWCLKEKKTLLRDKQLCGSRASTKTKIFHLWDTPRTRYRVRKVLWFTPICLHVITHLGLGKGTLEFRLNMAGSTANSKSIRNEDKASLRFYCKSLEKLDLIFKNLIFTALRNTHVVPQRHLLVNDSEESPNPSVHTWPIFCRQVVIESGKWRHSKSDFVKFYTFYKDSQHAMWLHTCNWNDMKDQRFQDKANGLTDPNRFWYLQTWVQRFLSTHELFLRFVHA